MQRVVIAPKVATIGLGLLTLFAVSALAIGVLLIVGAEGVARESEGSPMAVRICGAVIGAVAGWVVVRVVPQWRAIAVIYRDEDGWGLVDRLGRVTGIDAGTEVEIALRCRRVVFTWGAAPRIQDVVDGEVRAASVTRRLAPSGRFTYGRVLGELGIAGEAPQRGKVARYRARA